MLKIMKRILLSNDNESFIPFIYNGIEDISEEFIKRNIKIGKKVVLGDNIRIGYNVIIQGDIQIEDNVTIDHDSRFGDFARFGEGTRDKPNTTYIGRGCSFAAGCTICLSVNIGENNVFGEYVFITNDTIIGNNCTFKEYSELFSNRVTPLGITIENNVNIGLGVYINDNIIIRNNATITDYCSIGNMEGGSEVEEGEVVNRYNVRYF